MGFRQVGPAKWCSPGQPQRPGFLLVKRVAGRAVEGEGEAFGGLMPASRNPDADAVDSARFGPVPGEEIVDVVLGRY